MRLAKPERLDPKSTNPESDGSVPCLDDGRFATTLLDDADELAPIADFVSAVHGIGVTVAVTSGNGQTNQ